MEASKTSRFGKKAMSLFLSGAMVMAFAPAVAAPAAQALDGTTAKTGTIAKANITPSGDGAHVADDASGTITYVGKTEVKVELSNVTVDAGGKVKYEIDLDGESGNNFSYVEFTPGGNVTVDEGKMTSIADNASVKVTWTENTGASALDLFKNATVEEVKVANEKAAIKNGKVSIEKEKLLGSTGKTFEAAITAIKLKNDSNKVYDTSDTDYWETYLVRTNDESPVDSSDMTLKKTNGAYTLLADSVDGVAANANLTADGKYWLVVKGKHKDATKEAEKNNFDGLATAIEVELLGKSVDVKGLGLFEVNDKKADDVSDTTFTWNGADQSANVGVQLDGKVLAKGTDYTINFIDGSGASATVLKAGSYRAVVKGIGDYSGQKELALTVAQLDLSTADIELEFDNGMKVKKVTAAGEKRDVAAGMLGEFTLNAQGNAYVSGAEDGEYKYTVALKEDANANAKGSVTGTATATYATGEQVLIGYDGGLSAAAQAAENPRAEVVIDKGVNGYADYQKSFFTDNRDEVTNDMLDVEVKNAETGAAATEADLLTAGRWTVKVTVNGSKTNYKYAGSRTFDFVVKEGSVASVAATYGGNLFNKNAYATDYTGSDLLGNLAFDAKSGKNEALTAGTDFKVKVTKEGKEVSGIVDAGEYKITISDGAYEVKGSYVFTLTVNPITVTKVVVNPEEGKDAGKNYAYTGEAIEPALAFYKGGEVKKANRVELPAAAWKVVKVEKNDTTYETAKEIKDAGTYRVTIAKDNAYEGKGNYELNIASGANTFELTVDKAVIKDAALDGERVGSSYDYFRYDFTGEAIVPAVTAYDETIGGIDVKEIKLPEGALEAEVVKHNSDDTNTTVSEIKGAGTYLVTYKLKDDEKIAKNYTWQNGKSFTVRVGKPAIAHIEVDPALFTDKAVVAYTGKAIAPTYRFWTANPATSTKAEQVELGAGAYKVSYLFSQSINANGNLVAPKAVDEILEVGYYQPIFLDLNEDDEYVFGTTGLPGGRLIQVAQASDPTKVTQLSQKISKVTPTSKTVKGVKKGKLKAKKTFKVKATGAKTSVTFAKANKAGGSKIAVSKAGKVTVKKGTKKGTYKVKVKATAKATATYKAATKTVTVKITVK